MASLSISKDIRAVGLAGTVTTPMVHNSLGTRLRSEAIRVHHIPRLARRLPGAAGALQAMILRVHLRGLPREPPIRIIKAQTERRRHGIQVRRHLTPMELVVGPLLGMPTPRAHRILTLRPIQLRTTAERLLVDRPGVERPPVGRAGAQRLHGPNLVGHLLVLGANPTLGCVSVIQVTALP
jgi:hypothetical protein